MRRKVPQSFHAQRGAASLAIVFLGFLLVSVALLRSQELSSSALRDANASDQQVQALFLAESGLERATRRFVVDGIACGSLLENDIAIPDAGTFSIGAGSALAFDGLTSAGASCRVRVTGKTPGGVARTIEAMLTPFVVTTASRGSRDFACTVPAGENLLTVISVSWSTPAASTVSVNSVSLGGAAGVAAAAPIRNDDGTLRVSAQNFYVRNPPLGSAVAGTVSLSGATSGIIVGCLTLAGVNQTSPIDRTAANASRGGSPSVSLITGAASTFVIDNMVRDNGGNLAMVSAANPARTEIWNFTPSGNAGAGSYRGPFASGATAVMNWTWNQNKIWAIAALSVAGDTSGGSGGRVRLPGGGVAGWREVVAAPPP